jgi:hypothetical protein
MVMDDAPARGKSEITVTQRQRIFEAAKGCLGTQSREQALEQLAQLRQDWNRGSNKISVVQLSH